MEYGSREHVQVKGPGRKGSQGSQGSNEVLPIIAN